MGPDSAPVARSGCPDALGRLLERFRPLLLAEAARARECRLQSKAGESDLVQDSLLEGHRGFPSFRGQTPEELLAWLKQILAHNVADFRRCYRDAQRRQVRLERVLPATGPAAEPGGGLASRTGSPSDEVHRREVHARLEAAINRLPRLAKLVVTWRQRDGLAFDEIGRRVGRTPGSARQIWWRAINQLKTDLRR